MRKRLNNKLAFTMIELIIAVSIFFILVLMSYAPYSYYQKKAKLRIASKQIVQSLSEARNMAKNGFKYKISGKEVNMSVGLYMDKSKKESLKFFAYPYYYSGSTISITPGPEIKLIKKVSLPEGIIINGINSKDNTLFFYNSISGKASFYSGNISLNNIIDTDYEIVISYKGATEGPLVKKIKYYGVHNISDY